MARSNPVEGCLGSYFHSQRVYNEGQYQLYRSMHSLDKCRHPTNHQRRSYDPRDATHLVVKFFIFHEIKMTLNVCDNGDPA